MDIFSMDASAKFARALADEQGITVKHESGSCNPYADEHGAIHIGVPDIYSHEDYMSDLHREVGKLGKDMSFFRSLETEKDSLEEAALPVLQGMRCEYNNHGTYKGRDNILMDRYSQDMKRNGGVSSVINEVAKENPTIAAMLWHGNELRNDWQGYQHCPVPEGLEDEVDRLSFLKDEWLSLETEEDLQRILQRIQYEEQQGGSGSDGGESEDGSDEDGDGDTESGDTEQEASGRAGEGEQSEGTPEGDGEPAEPEESGAGDGEGSGEESESGDGDTEGETGDGEGESDDPSEDSPDGDSEGEQQQSESGEGDTEGQDSEDAGDNQQTGQERGVGACDAKNKLADMGIIKPPQDKGTQVHGRKPYTPATNEREIDIPELYKNGERPVAHWRDSIENTLGSFKLSKKVRKYLIAMKQTGYEYGKKRGSKICAKNLYRVMNKEREPRIFKEKLATKIQKDTAIMVLGDCSGSMHGQEYCISASCQIAISEVLQVLGIPHAMTQFTTSHGSIVHYHMKHFQELRVSRDKLLDRFSYDMNMNTNADGESVTKAAQRLAVRPESNKILIVLSDGYPAFSHEGDDDRFLKDTVKQIDDSKVMDILGIGICSSSVKQFYPKYKVVRHLPELESVLMNLLKDKVLK